MTGSLSAPPNDLARVGQQDHPQRVRRWNSASQIFILRVAIQHSQRRDDVVSRVRGGQWRAGCRQPGCHETELHHLDRAGADDRVVGRQPASGADHGRLWAGLRLPLRATRDCLPHPDGPCLGGARLGLEGRRVPLGHRGHLAEHGVRRRLAPVRHDDLLLPDLAVVRGQHPRVRDLSGVGLQRRVDGRRDHLGLLARRGARAPGWHRCDRQAGLQRRSDRNADPRRAARDLGHRLPRAGQPVGRPDDRGPPAAGLDRDREHRADRQQLRRLLRDGDERRPRQRARESEQAVPEGHVRGDDLGAVHPDPSAAGDQLVHPGRGAQPDRRCDAGVRCRLRSFRHPVLDPDRRPGDRLRVPRWIHDLALRPVQKPAAGIDRKAATCRRGSRRPTRTASRSTSWPLRA